MMFNLFDKKTNDETILYYHLLCFGLLFKPFSAMKQQGNGLMLRYDGTVPNNDYSELRLNLSLSLVLYLKVILLIRF